MPGLPSWKPAGGGVPALLVGFQLGSPGIYYDIDRKSTRLNSSHQIISYAVFCLKKKNEALSAFERVSQEMTLPRSTQPTLPSHATLHRRSSRASTAVQHQLQRDKQVGAPHHKTR